MFWFIRQVFIGFWWINTEYKFLYNQVRPTLISINSNESLDFPFVVSVNRCGGSYNVIDDPYAQIYNPDKKIWL